MEKSDTGDYYEGYTNDERWNIHVSFEVLSKAHHILTMQGISRTRQNKILIDPMSRFNDPTLRELEGVKIVAVEDLD